MGSFPPDRDRAPVFSLLVILVALVIVVLVLANRGSQHPYPGCIWYGLVMIEFSKVDRVCYSLAAVSVVVGVVSGIVLIWGPGADEFGKVLATAGLVFVGAALVLVLNRLMRGRGST